MPMPLASTDALWHKAGMADDPEKARKRLQNLLREALKVAKSVPQKSVAIEDTAMSFGAQQQTPSRYHIEPYGHTRYHALREGGELVVVTVYKKGAAAVQARLQGLEARIAELEARLAARTQEQKQDNPKHMGAVERLQAERDTGTARTQGYREQG